jgi:hypothetical protein
MKRWWLSFCDTKKPAGEQFLGACIVNAHRLDEAIQVAHILGCNPGGEIMAHDIPDGIRIDQKWMERLLSRPECEALGVELGKNEEAAP